MAKTFEKLDMGIVTLAGDPTEEYSVIWVKFGGIPQLKEVEQYSVPVSTKELVEAGIDPSTERYFWAKVNVAAQQRSEADPTAFEVFLELTPQQRMEANAAWIGETTKGEYNGQDF